LVELSSEEFHNIRGVGVSVENSSTTNVVWHKVRVNSRCLVPLYELAHRGLTGLIFFCRIGLFPLKIRF
jgi:hypothetical protein